MPERLEAPASPRGLAVGAVLFHVLDLEGWSGGGGAELPYGPDPRGPADPFMAFRVGHKRDRKVPYTTAVTDFNRRYVGISTRQFIPCPCPLSLRCAKRRINLGPTFTAVSITNTLEVSAAWHVGH